MKIVIEPGDFPETSGKTAEALSDPMYGFVILHKRLPDGRSVTHFNHRGANHVIESEKVSVEIEGAAPPEPVAETPAVEQKPKAPRGPGGKFVKAEPEPALTGPRLQDTTDWLD
jgi:hypothetical protein